MGAESKAAVWTRTAIVALGGIVFLFPFVWMVSTSLTTTDELFKLPPSILPNPIDTSTYDRLFTDVPILKWVFNSVLVSLLVTFLQVLSSAMAAYAFTRLNFKGRNVVFVLFLATLMVPFQVMIVPLFIELRYMGLLNSYGALIIPEIAMPFGVFLLRQAFLSLPRELEEAAFVEGAGHIRVFFRLVLPLSKPAIATVAVFSFMGSWNNFLWPLVVINTPGLMTLPLGLSSMSSRFVTDWNLLLAGATISALPIVAVFLFAQRYVLEGVAMSGLKG